MQHGRLNNVNLLKFSYIMKCPCCGSEMKKEKELEYSILMKCTVCGLSDTIVKS